MGLAERLGQAIAAARVEAGLSQDELATFADTDRRYVSRVEQGLDTLALARIGVMLDALGLDVHVTRRTGGPIDGR